MRSFEEDSREETSEDDHPSTDASEDSVEVRVTSISGPPPQRHLDLGRLPRKFRKAFQKDIPIAAPLDFSVTSLTTSPDHPQKGDSTTPPGSSSPPRVKATNRRKLSEPRRVVEHETSGVKRPLEEDWVPRKAPKGDDGHAVPGTPHGEEIPQPNLLGHNPFIGHFVPPQFLLPPAWPHVARYPYAHLVGGVLGPPLGLLPTAPYPLLPILPPRAPPPASPKPSQIESLSMEEEKPIKINGTTVVPLHPQTPSVPSSDSQTESSFSRRAPSKSSSSRKFLSVESLLSTSEPKLDAGRCDPSLAPAAPKDPRLQEPDFLASSSPSNEGTIQSLLQRQPKQKQRNYKNMTRERRIEANARERTRVHTISAAFETLRRAVPSFSHNQKLSKLSVLRIASAYILSLSRLAGYDYSQGGACPSFEECVDLTTKTIQVEGKTKKKRDD